MEYLGFKFEESIYNKIDQYIEAKIIDDEGKIITIKILDKKGEYYYFKPTYIDKEKNIKLYKRFMDFEIKIHENSIEYFSTKVCKSSLEDNDVLEALVVVVKKTFNKKRVVINIDKKFKVNSNEIVINEKFFDDLKELNKETKILDNVLYNTKSTKINEFLYNKKYLKELNNKKVLYQPNLLKDILNSSVLAYSDDTILNKLTEDDIKSLQKTITKLASVLDFRYIKNIREKELLKEAISIGEKVLKINKEASSKNTIKDLYNNYLKQKDFDKFFKGNLNNQLEKLWEAYITKYSNLIFDVDHSNIDNQFEIKRTNRKYIPDFVVSDSYGAKTIIEIKTHNVSVIKYDNSHDCLYFSSSCNKAIGQLQSYIKKSVLSENDDKEYFSSAKGIIIIGNRHNDQKDNIDSINVPKGEDKVDYYYKNLRDLNSVLINIEIVYFDDLIEAMKKRLNRLI